MRVLDHLEEWLVTFLMGAATVIIFFAVLHRYAAGLAIPEVQDWLLELDFGWAQELCIIMFVWMAKFGAAYGVRTGIHVGVDVLINRLPGKLRSRFIVFGLLAGATFTGIVGALGAYFVWDNGLHYALFHALGVAMSDVPKGPITPDLEWPTWIVYSAIPLGSTLMCFRFLQVAWNFIHSGKLPHHDPGQVAGLDEGEAQIGAKAPSREDQLHPRDPVDDSDDVETDRSRRRSAARRATRGEGEGQ